MPPPQDVLTAQRAPGTVKTSRSLHVLHPASAHLAWGGQGPGPEGRRHAGEGLTVRAKDAEAETSGRRLGVLTRKATEKKAGPESWQPATLGIGFHRKSQMKN